MVKVKYININKHTITKNLKHNTNDPPIRVSNGKYGKPTYYHEYITTGPVKIVYNPNDPLPCGARVWIEEWSK